MDNIDIHTANIIRTNSGQWVDVFDPDPDTINIEDIAHALSHLCRFGGHVPKFYSVAEHSVLCTALAPDHLKLDALLHDASEAYLVDLPRPIKRNIPDYKKIEAKLMVVIAQKFGFLYPMPQLVQKADEYMLDYEWDCFVKKKTYNDIKCYAPDMAKKLFLKKFKQIA